jgi:anti-sigma regulatory factor (Ser/Thr protein kinase)
MTAPAPVVLADFELPSRIGNERAAIDQVVGAVSQLALPGPTMEKLKTAVGEATMNAIEHGNGGRAEIPVQVHVEATPDNLIVKVTDQGGGGGDPIVDPEAPDLDAKLAGIQSPRGWGLFLIKNMVDDLRISSTEGRHTIELVIHLKGAPHGRTSV